MDYNKAKAWAMKAIDVVLIDERMCRYIMQVISFILIKLILIGSFKIWN